MDQEKKLGRGFDELLDAGMTGLTGGTGAGADRATGGGDAYIGDEILQLPLDSIAPNRFQPRQEMAPEALQDLKDSISRDGVLQPIIVRPAANGYELIAGERRWRAARDLGLAVIPAIVRQADDQHALELALIENIQREDLNPIDKAHAYRQLMTTFDLTQEEAAVRVGQERASVANTLRLLDLPASVQTSIARGDISMGHAKALMALNEPALVLAAAGRVVSEGMSVREIENMILAGKRRGRPRVRKPKAPEVVALEDRLRSHFGTKVEVQHTKRRGKITIEYYSMRDLDRILAKLNAQ